MPTTNQPSHKPHSAPETGTPSTAHGNAAHTQAAHAPAHKPQQAPEASHKPHSPQPHSHPAQSHSAREPERKTAADEREKTPRKDQREAQQARKPHAPSAKTADDRRTAAHAATSRAERDAPRQRQDEREPVHRVAQSASIGLRQAGAHMQEAQQEVRRAAQSALAPFFPAMLFSQQAWWPFARNGQQDFASLFEFPRSMLRLSDQMFQHMLEMQNMTQSLLTGGMITRSSVQPRENEYVFTVEMPGFDAQDVDIAISQDRIRITADRDSSSKARGQTEERHTHFERVFPLSSDSNPDKARAKFEQGRLTITVPRGESPAKQARHLDIAARAA